MIRKPIFFLMTLLIVSCSETVESDELLINNLVVMEDQIQRMNIIQLDRGNDFAMDIKSEYFSTPRTDEMKMKSSKLEYIVNKIDEIDTETSLIISLLDDYKFELLRLAGESTKEDNKKDISSIVWRKYDIKKDGNSPSRLNLSAIKQKDNAEVATSYFVSSDKLNPTDKGLELWKALNNYRTNLVKITGSYSWGDKDFKVNPMEINSFSTNQELEEKVRKMIESSNANLKEDAWVLIDLYMILTKQERIDYSDASVHWICSTFKGSPLVNAIASLSTLQNDILSARALALAQWKSKVATCGYSFNTIIPIATGPSVSREGEEVQIKIMMAAFDSDNQPFVTTSNANAIVSYSGDGTGVITFVPKSGLNTYKGTISLKNKAGVPRTEDWEWKVNVLPK